MSTSVQHFLSNLRRSLSPVPAGRMSTRPTGIYRVTAVNEPFIGKHIGDCVVEQRVGQGAMSVVYRATQDITERRVAVKMLRAQLCTDPTNVKRFQREAKAISRLNHPNLLNVYHVGTAHTGQPFIVMDFIEGRSLAAIVQDEGPLHWQRAINIFAQVCDAMHHAHDHAVIHRDLKPANIMLVQNAVGEDVVKVVDFGVVKLTDESQRLSQKLTNAGEVWGSPMYMSPEQCSGHELDLRSDVYSLGTVMYECLTGQTVFTGKNVTELVMKQLASDPKPFSEACPQFQIPERVEKVVMKALAKDPSKRFRTMADMRAALVPPASKPAGQAAKPAMPVPAAANGDPFINRLIGGSYVIQSFIGEGGMSRVYKAVQNGTGRVVAVKIMREELLDQENYIKRFDREAKSLAHLTHPNLTAVYDVGQTEDGQPYMVIEYLDGQSLRERIVEHGSMTVKEALPILIQVCDVLDYAHKEGIIHRDIKPHNIMVVSQSGRNDVVKVVDFGIVKFDESIISVSQKLTASGEICGSPMYMSPEQIVDEPLDGRTDMYSLGAVMYEIISGKPLFSGTKITDVMKKHVHVQPHPLSAVCPEIYIPPSFDALVLKCVEKRAANRYQTMGELKQALLQVKQELERPGPPTGTPVPPSATAAGHGTSRGGNIKRSINKGWERSRIIMIIAGVAVVALIAGVIGTVGIEKLTGESPVTTPAPEEHEVHHPATLFQHSKAAHHHHH